LQASRANYRLKLLPISEILEIEKGKRIRACGTIPEGLALFQDHFPEFAVLPGVLSLEILKSTAERYAVSADAEDDGAEYRFKQIRNVRFTHFLKPGDRWESVLELVGTHGNESGWRGKLFHEGRAVASAQWVLVKK